MYLSRSGLVLPIEVSEYQFAGAGTAWWLDISSKRECCNGRTDSRLNDREARAKKVKVVAAEQAIKGRGNGER
jgi:hypothetical protein